MLKSVPKPPKTVILLVLYGFGTHLGTPGPNSGPRGADKGLKTTQNGNFTHFVWFLRPIWAPLEALGVLMVIRILKPLDFYPFCVVLGPIWAP